VSRLDRPIKILHVFGRMNRGGAELRTLDVMRHVNPAHVHMDFCTLSGLPGELDSEIVRMEGEVYPCKLGVGFGRRFRALIRDLKPDVIHSHVHYVSGYILYLASKERVSVRVAHFRSTGDGKKNTWKRWAQNMVLRRLIDINATNILAVSNAAMNSAWLQYMPEDARCTVIYNGLDTTAYENIGSSADVRSELGVSVDTKIVINISKFAPEKNHLKMVSVLHKLRQRGITPVLVLVGKGDNALQEEVIRRAQELGVADQLRIVGIRSDVPRLIAAADALLFPSLREGLPGVVLEACIVGTPVVASTLPGILEISERFETVKCLDVDAADEYWADRVTNALDLNICRTGAIKSFRASEFTVEKASRSLENVWRGGQHVNA